MARTDPNEPGGRGVSAFIVERGTPGLSVGKPDKKMGQQGAHIADVILEDVRVPAANIIGGVPEQGFRTAMKTLDRGRVHVDRKSVVKGKSVSVRVDLGGRRIHKKKKNKKKRKQ